MGAFIYKPLLYCYISLVCHAELVSAPHMQSKHHAGGQSQGYLSADGLSMGCRTKFSMTDGVKFHPIHVSTSNIEYNAKDNKFEVICTLFTDDFEAALAKQYHAKTDLNKQEMHAAMDALVKQYIAANLYLKADDKTVNLNYLGFEINREATDVYLESDKLPVVKKVDVDASLLYNLFDDEINIVHVIVNGVRKSEKVNYPDKRVEQVF
jgi:hypothetical protein